MKVITGQKGCLPVFCEYKLSEYAICLTSRLFATKLFAECETTNQLDWFFLGKYLKTGLLKNQKQSVQASDIDELGVFQQQFIIEHFFFEQSCLISFISENFTSISACNCVILRSKEDLFNNAVPKTQDFLALMSRDRNQRIQMSARKTMFFSSSLFIFEHKRLATLWTRKWN